MEQLGRLPPQQARVPTTLMAVQDRHVRSTGTSTAQYSTAQHTDGWTPSPPRGQTGQPRGERDMARRRADTTAFDGAEMAKAMLGHATASHFEARIKIRLRVRSFAGQTTSDPIRPRESRSRSICSLTRLIGGGGNAALTKESERKKGSAFCSLICRRWEAVLIHACTAWTCWKASDGNWVTGGWTVDRGCILRVP